MIYGANGFTGKLIAEEAKRRNLTPILAGRSPSVKELAEKLQLDSRIFPLNDQHEIARNLEGVTAVLNCAGPFSGTSRAMLDGCVIAKTNYFDITGEISVFEAIHERDPELKAAGITAIPGVGFDVVPTDCVAAMLKKRLPNATELKLGFKMDGASSAGTAKSAIEGLSAGGRVRKDGEIITVPNSAKTLELVFESHPVFSVLIPWGDVSTAYYSTGIPNIEVYMASSKPAAGVIKMLGILARVPGMQSILKTLIGKTTHGPSKELLENGRSWIWGEVRNMEGETASMRIVTPNGYTLTVDSAITAVTRALEKELKPGAFTPSQAFGADFVFELKNVKLITERFL